MIVIHSYLIKPDFSEHVTNSAAVTLAFSHYQLILHTHMSQAVEIIGLCLEHSSSMKRYDKCLREFRMGGKNANQVGWGKLHQSSLL